MGELKTTELVISVQIAEAIVNYLASRPYIEVFKLIEAMQQLEPLTGAQDADAEVRAK